MSILAAFLMTVIREFLANDGFGINLARTEGQTAAQKDQFLLNLTLHEGDHTSSEYDNLPKETEEALVRNHQATAVDSINFYHSKGDYSDSTASNLTGWAYSNSSAGSQYNLSSNYLNGLYSSSTANVTQSSIAANNAQARGANQDKIEPYKIKTAEVEKGDTLTSISKEINSFYGTKYDAATILKINGLDENYTLTIGDKIKVGTIDEKTNNVWIMPYGNPDAVTLNYWDQRTEDQQKILHYGRGIFEDDNLPKTSSTLKQNENNLWENKGAAIAHNLNGASGNTDYRGSDSRLHQQAIYDKSGNLVTTPENAGSYDYISPKQSVTNHLSVDVAPWIKWGNTPTDTTTNQDRISAMKSDPLGTGGYLYLKIFDNLKTQ